MDAKFVFKFGKYAGKTYEWVEENAASYLEWARVNAPNLLKEPKPKVVKPVQLTTVDCPPQKTMQPNLNFWNEGPDEKSKPYLEKMNLLKPKETDWGF